MDKQEIIRREEERLKEEKIRLEQRKKDLEEKAEEQRKQIMADLLAGKFDEEIIELDVIDKEKPVE